MKKRKLKRWVKVVLFVICILALYKIGITSFEKTARECDEYYGYTCDLNLVDKFGKGIKYER